MWDMAGKGKNTLLILQRVSAREKSGGKKVTYTNPTAAKQERAGAGSIWKYVLCGSKSYLAVPQVSENWHKR